MMAAVVAVTVVRIMVMRMMRMRGVMLVKRTVMIMMVMLL